MTKERPTPARIVAAACRLPSGAIVSFPPPARHHTVLHALAADGFKAIGISGKNQGFVTDAGEYVTREQACSIARAAGQIIEKTGPADQLFSEDVW